MIPKKASSIACVVTVSVFGMPTFAAASDSQLTLTEPAAVAVAESLSKAIDVVSIRVSECLAAKAAPAQLCFCRYPAEVKRLRTEYESALVKFPAWQAKVLNWSPLGQKGSRSISMVGLASQFRQECPK